MPEKEVNKIDFDELKEATKPLLEFLRKNGHPHMTAVVTGRSVTLTEEIMGIPVDYED